MKRRIFLKAATVATTSLSLSQLNACGSSSNSSADTSQGQNQNLNGSETTININSDSQMEFDVVVIGAGLSGLCAARKLVENDVSVLVVEARSRVGGRTYNQPVATKDAIIEGGGQWVGSTQTEILALARELDIGVFNTWNTGETVGLFEGYRLIGAELNSTPEEVNDLNRVIALIDKMAVTVPLNNPWEAVNALSWDAQYLGDWLDANTLTQTARLELESGVSSILAASSSRISLLWFLFYIHSAGGYNILQSIEGGAQQSRFLGGSQQISLKLAQDLGKRQIIFDEEVKQINEDDEHIYVQLKNQKVKADHVIIAMMPADANKIAFTPPLPPMRSNLQKNWATSSGFKIHIVYPTAFWRDAGLSGQAFTDTGVSSVFDNSQPSGSPGSLIIFAERDMLPGDKKLRMQQIVTTLVQLFGNEAASPVEYIELDWAEEKFTQGCESPLGLNVLTEYGRALRPSVGRVHWAGTETSSVWNGYMEGAVRAGKKAAAEIIEIL